MVIFFMAVLKVYLKMKGSSKFISKRKDFLLFNIAIRRNFLTTNLKMIYLLKLEVAETFNAFFLKYSKKDEHIFRPGTSD